MGRQGEEPLELSGCLLASVAGVSPHSGTALGTYPGTALGSASSQTPSSGTRHDSQPAGKAPGQGAGLSCGRSDGALAEGWGGTCGVRVALAWAPSLAKAGDAGRVAEQSMGPRSPLPPTGRPPPALIRAAVPA